jgi:hypothetical protein
MGPGLADGAHDAAELLGLHLAAAAVVGAVEGLCAARARACAGVRGCACACVRARAREHAFASAWALARARVSECSRLHARVSACSGVRAGCAGVRASRSRCRRRGLPTGRSTAASSAPRGVSTLKRAKGQSQSSPPPAQRRASPMYRGTAAAEEGGVNLSQRPCESPVSETDVRSDFIWRQLGKTVRWVQRGAQPSSRLP